MKKYLLLLVVTVFCWGNCFGQAGEWTWMNGTNTINSQGNYGIKGIPSPTVYPPALYETCDWTDLQGNFWIYGGLFIDSAGTGEVAMADLWKFDPLTNEWTWVNGDGQIYQHHEIHYGIKDVADPLNTPGMRAFGAATWVDLDNNLWLYGGTGGYYDSIGNSHVGFLSDLWKYDINANMWTWVNGFQIFNLLSNCSCIPVSQNHPGSRSEFNTTWVDNQNNLWLYGGRGSDTILGDGALGDLWKYNIQNDQWSWIKGSLQINQYGVYGIQGVPSITNNPGARWSYSKWKDKQGNFWLYAGASSGVLTSPYEDLWKYDLATNEWTWMKGFSNSGYSPQYGTKCLQSSSNRPGARYENRSCWTDNCGKFWTYGGYSYGTSTVILSDLWNYDPLVNDWTFVSGLQAGNSAPSWGIQTVSNISNQPASRFGAVGFRDRQDNLWLFGGWGYLNGTRYYNDIWRFVPDTNCQGCNATIVADFFSNHCALCPGMCTTFLNLSVNAISYQWVLTGGIPNTSTATNPINICYPNPGTYDVQLIATNANGSDTLLLANYITVYPAPPPQSITQNGDTLFAIAGAGAYQWYFNTTIINGATDYFYIAPQNGDYNVVCTDANGCEVEAAVFNVVASVDAIGSEKVIIFPNPVGDKLGVRSGEFGEKTVSIKIFDMIGAAVRLRTPNTPLPTELDVSALAKGMYWLEVSSNEKIFRAKFVKE